MEFGTAAAFFKSELASFVVLALDGDVFGEVFGETPVFVALVIR